MDNIAATGARVIATGNPGCMMQIAKGMRERGLPMEVKHPIELLDEAYKVGGIYSSIPVRVEQGLQKKQQALLLGITGGLLISALLLSKRRRTK
jgi:glycolate oxidase iron-sulfur subunit